MIKANPAQIQENFEIICDEIIKNDQTVIVPRPNGENVVIISEAAFNEFLELKETIAYLEKIERSVAAAERGEVIIKTIEELEEYES